MLCAQEALILVFFGFYILIWLIGSRLFCFASFKKNVLYSQRNASLGNAQSSARRARTAEINVEFDDELFWSLLKGFFIWKSQRFRGRSRGQTLMAAAFRKTFFEKSCQVGSCNLHSCFWLYSCAFCRSIQSLYTSLPSTYLCTYLYELYFISEALCAELFIQVLGIFQ